MNQVKFKLTARTILNTWVMPVFMLVLSFWGIELFAFLFLSTTSPTVGESFFVEQQEYVPHLLEGINLWPLAFGLVWAVVLSCFVFIVPRKASKVVYGIFYFLFMIYAVVETGYYLLFKQMMWISDFRYASEGSDYFSALLDYPIGWWLGFALLTAIGIIVIWKFPRFTNQKFLRLLLLIPAVVGVVGARQLPKIVFNHDQAWYYASSDYGRAQSTEAAYENMFNAHRLYQVCGIYQTALKDIYTNHIYPITPSHIREQEGARAEICDYLQSRPSREENEMSGILEGKNIILVLMESMDDWMIGEHTPTIGQLMDEGINFTNFYTPGYGSIRTFNTEFCVNTGSFLRSNGGYAFDSVTNSYNHSLASQLTDKGYRALTFHYNDPSFYSRGVFSPAMGYEEYVSYQDYVKNGSTAYELVDDQLLFDNQELNNIFFSGEKKLNFVITRSAHLTYRYDETLSNFGLQKYPEYRGLTGNEETDCALLKAKLVDDFFARMLQELDEHGELENTVIVGFGDHYTYGYENTDALLDLSGVRDMLLVEKTPCFIWGAGVPAMTVDKLLNTSDLLPTLLNLLGVDSPYSYIGNDAFDKRYDGFVPFPNGSWIYGDFAYNTSNNTAMTFSGKKAQISKELYQEMTDRVQEYVKINNRILETDYYSGN